MRVYVKTPARLHMGLIDLNGNRGRIFGGLGVGINYPNVIIEAQPAETLRVTGEKTEHVKALAQRFFDAYSIKAKAQLHVKQTIPEHVGLGSGTQLALAVATALAKLCNVKASTAEVALAMGRAKRSGIGTTVFEQGGFVVDGGKCIKNGVAAPECFPPSIFHCAFPENWRFVVAIPNSKKGLSKDAEIAAFKQLPPMAPEKVGEICRLIMLKLLPALVEQDIKGFGKALTQIQIIVGTHFAPAQGGTYSSEITTEGIRLLQKLGVHGVGQSSWGPTFYGLCQNEKEAEEIRAKISAFLNNGADGEVFIAKANNKGAFIRVWC
ncbi:MAG: beta-ribofuranosylaminobenzene 5'-phosphate synthase family protein [Candidatus Bathyarchaeales archaeon]